MFATTLEEAVARRRPRPGERSGGHGAEAPPPRRDRGHRSARTRSSPRRPRACCRRCCRRIYGSRSAFLVAHPFNPVYLLPLVEIVGGEQTSEESIARAIELYASVGMKPLRDPVRDRRLRRRPAARGALAGGALARPRRHRDGRGDRRRDPVRAGTALGADGDVPHVSHRRRRGGHAPLPRAVRPRPRVALDEADRRARPRRDAHRQDRDPVRRAGGRALRTGARAAPRRQPRRHPAGASLSALRGRRGAPRARGPPARGRGAGLDARPRPAARALRGRRRSVLGRLQRPHDRVALPAGLRRSDRRAPRPSWCRRRLPRTRPQRLHGRDAHPASPRGCRPRADRGRDADPRRRRRSACTCSTG